MEDTLSAVDMKAMRLRGSMKRAWYGSSRCDSGVLKWTSLLVQLHPKGKLLARKLDAVHFFSLKIGFHEAFTFLSGAVWVNMVNLSVLRIIVDLLTRRRLTKDAKEAKRLVSLACHSRCRQESNLDAALQNVRPTCDFATSGSSCGA